MGSLVPKAMDDKEKKGNLMTSDCMKTADM